MEPSSDDRATSLAAPTSKGRIVIPSRIRRNVVLEPLQIPIKLKGGLKWPRCKTTDQLIGEMKKG